MNQAKKVAVIGAGVIGLSCAFRLAKEGISVVLFDKGKYGSGASGASLGAMWPPTPLRKTPFHDMHRQSLEMFEQFLRDIEQITEKPISYSRCGALEIIPSQSQFEMARKEVEEAENCSLSGLRLLSTEECNKLEPAVEHSEFGALHCSDTAWVEVSNLLSSLYASCRKLGIEIREGEEVASIQVEDDRVTGVATLDGSQIFDTVLVTAGAWTSALSSSLQKYSPIRPVRGQALSVELPKLPIHRIVKKKPIYIIPQSEHSVLIGSTTEPNVGFNDYVTEEAIEKLWQSACELVPEISNGEIGKCWAGLRPMGYDRKPFLGKVPDVIGLYVASGHNKTGFAMAPVTASALTELIVHGTTDYAIDSVPPRIVEERMK